MSIRLRPATWEDFEDLLRWKNDPTVRKFSIVTQDKITRATHTRWLTEHLDEIFIIEDSENSYGDIRFEGDEIAIKLDPAFRGRGIGSMALSIAKDMKTPLRALIVDGNVPSMRLFLSQGFEVVGHKDNYYILAYNGEG